METLFIVLGRAHEHGELDVDGVRRIAELCRRRDEHPHIRHVLLSGGCKSTWPQSEARQMEALLTGEWDGVLLEEWSRTTAENAACVAAMLERHDVRDVVIVTSREHALRSWVFFRLALRGRRVGVRLLVTPGMGLRGWAYEARWLPNLVRDIRAARRRVAMVRTALSPLTDPST